MVNIWKINITMLISHNRTGNFSILFFISKVSEILKSDGGDIEEEVQDRDIDFT